MKKIGLMFLALCLCSAELYAQEIANQGWAATEPRPRASGAISVTETGSVCDSSRLSRALIPAVIQKENGKEITPPFPVLTPTAIVYPRKAVREGWEGKTVVAAEVLPDGSVGRTALAKTSGHEVLDKAAQESIKDWKFETGSPKDESVPQYVDIPVTFKLQKED
jgi:protein TonB